MVDVILHFDRNLLLIPFLVVNLLILLLLGAVRAAASRVLLLVLA